MVIEVNGVWKKFPKIKKPNFLQSIKQFIKPQYKWALKNVSFSVKRGEIFGLLGPNGAGKTTLIKILLGLMAPDKGKVHILGYDIQKERKEVSGKINACFARANLYWTLSGYENLKLFAKIYRIEDYEEKIKDLVKLFDLKDKIYRHVDTYSTGEIMRLNLARALINDPEILFLDEPTLGLDPYISLKLRDFIAKLNKEFKTTILLTTHYMEEADRLCKRIAIIDKGKILKIDTPENLKLEIKKEKVIEIRANPITQEILNEIKEMRGVEGIIYIEEEEKIRILLKNMEIIEKITNLLNKNKIKIVEIQTDRPTLEDVFLHLTSKGLRYQNEVF